MDVDVRISNPEVAGSVTPTALVRLEQLIRDELKFAPAPTAATLDARREQLRVLARTKTAIAITKDTTSTSVVTDADVAAASDEQAYAGYVLAFKSDRCIGSVDTGGETWHPTDTGCAFPIDPDGDLSSAEDGDIPAYYISIFATADVGMLVKTCSHCLPVETDFEPAGVALLFASTRGQVLDVRAPKATTPGLFALPEASEGARFLSWRGGACCGEACLEIDYVGDPPFVRDHVWFAPEDGRERDIPCVESPGKLNPCEADRPQPPRVARFEDACTLAEFATTRLQEFELRNARIAQAPTTTSQEALRKRLQRFWLLFDASTNPVLLTGAGPSLEQEEAIAEIYTVGAYLEASYLDRARRIAAGLPARDGTPAKGEVARRLVRIAEFTEARMQASVDEDGPLTQREFVEAFELFAGGQLTVLDAQGAPNGLNYFCFAELAIRRLEIGPDAFWSDHLQLFARTAEIFVNAYHMKGGQRRTCAYGIQFNPEGARGYGPQERKALADAWADDGVDETVQRYGELVAASLADEFTWKSRQRKATLVGRLRDRG